MGLLDFFKKKKKSKNMEFDSMMRAHMYRMFPGGKEELNSQVLDVKKLLRPEYKVEDVKKRLIYITSLLYTARDRSSYRIVEIGAMNKPDNIFSYEENMKIYRYATITQLKKLIPNFDSLDKATQERFIEDGLAAMGNNPKGCITDEIPNGYGEFGLCISNPIPTRGTGSNEDYLDSLKHVSGNPIKWKRIGSMGTPISNYPVDCYQIYTKEGIELTKIYISPYQNTISKKAPKGFYI